MSGLSRTPGKRVWANPHRGFESRPLRQIQAQAVFCLGFFVFFTAGVVGLAALTAMSTFPPIWLAQTLACNKTVINLSYKEFQGTATERCETCL